MLYLGCNTQNANTKQVAPNALISMHDCVWKISGMLTKNAQTSANTPQHRIFLPVRHHMEFYPAFNIAKTNHGRRPSRLVACEARTNVLRIDTFWADSRATTIILLSLVPSGGLYVCFYMYMCIYIYICIHIYICINMLSCV